MKCDCFFFDRYHFDPSGLLFRDGQRVPLEPIQSGVLRALLQDAGRIVTKFELIERAWRGGDVSDESIARAIYQLRKALGTRRDEYIEAVSGRGYRFVCPVQYVSGRSRLVDSVRKDSATEDIAMPNSAGVSGLLNAARALASDHDAMLGYWDLELRCRYANAAYEVWFGRSQASMLGISMPELLGPLFRLNLPYIKGVEAGQPQHFKRLITLPNGTARSSLASYFPDFRDGRVQGFSVLVVDAERFQAF